MGSSKILTLSNLKKVLAKLRKEEKKIVTTNGVFDILHPGHITLLEKAKKLGYVLIVLVNSDKSVKKIKGKNRPINNEVDRAKLISALECVNYVSIFNEDDPRKILN